MLSTPFCQPFIFGSDTNLDFSVLFDQHKFFLDHLASRARILNSTAVTQQTGALRLAKTDRRTDDSCHASQHQRIIP